MVILRPMHHIVRATVVAHIPLVSIGERLISHLSHRACRRPSALVIITHSILKRNNPMLTRLPCTLPNTDHGIPRVALVELSTLGRSRRRGLVARIACFQALGVIGRVPTLHRLARWPGAAQLPQTLRDPQVHHHPVTPSPLSTPRSTPIPHPSTMEIIQHPVDRRIRIPQRIRCPHMMHRVLSSGRVRGKTIVVTHHLHLHLILIPHCPTATPLCITNIHSICPSFKHPSRTLLLRPRRVPVTTLLTGLEITMDNNPG